MSNHVKSCALVGVGAMGVEYAKVLKHIGVEFEAIGRGATSTAKFKEATGVAALEGGVEAYKGSQFPNSAIIATNVETLASATIAAIKKGARRVLVEKPGALSVGELDQVMAASREYSAHVFIAYNRRFLASVLELKRLVDLEGGATSGHFEFTEWGHVISTLPESPAKRTTFLSNSTHVVDLAFYLLGKPKEMSSFRDGAGELAWNEGASRFTGAGRTDKGALFTYCANWTAPGRWGVEVMTRESRYILRPLEKLQKQKIGSVQVEELPLDLVAETGLKPGLVRKVEAFFEKGSVGGLVNLEQQRESFSVYEKMAGKL